MLAFLDIETTGVNEAMDPILEVGIALTSEEPPFDVAGAVNVVVPWPAEYVDGCLARDDYVRDMHAGNGLRDEVVAEWGKLSSALSAVNLPPRIALAEGPVPLSSLPLDRSQNALMAFLADHGRHGRFLMAGSGIGHFDRRFLRLQMPLLEAWFRYPNLDVGVIRRTMQIIGREDLVPLDPKKKAHSDDPGSKDAVVPHRGLPDALDHLREFKAYAVLLSSIEIAGPSVVVESVP